MAEKNNDVVFVEERQSCILQMLMKDQKLLVDDLSKTFAVSSATIRNDLNLLSRRGLLKRTHGGAVPVSKVNFELTTSEKAARYLSEKQRIAQAASKLVDDGDTIALDTGSTTALLAEALKVSNLTVVTNDINIALYLEKNEGYRVVLLGGLLRSNYHCTLGPTTTGEMKMYHVDKAFIATNSISIQYGLSTPDIYHAEIKKSMIEAANEVILLATSNKFDCKSFVNFAKVETLTHIVTDDAIRDEDVRALQAMNIKTTIV